MTSYLDSKPVPAGPAAGQNTFSYRGHESPLSRAAGSLRLALSDGHRDEFRSDFQVYCDNLNSDCRLKLEDPGQLCIKI